MGYWSGGGVSFSGGPYTYSYSFSAPSYVLGPGESLQGISGGGGSGSVGCGGSVSASWTATVSYAGASYDDQTTISGSAPACPVPTYPPSWSDNTLAGFTATVAYSDGVSATNSPTYSVSSGSLPSGISLNSSTGAVTGTPTTAGQSYSFVLRAANGDGAVTASFSGTVAAAPSAGKWRVWTGTTWVVGPVKVWNGTSWVDSSVKVWNGSSWVTSV